MKFCPVVPEICRGQIHGGRKERRRIIIIIRNGAKTISLQTLFGRLNEHKKSSIVCYELPRKYTSMTSFSKCKLRQNCKCNNLIALFNLV